MTPQEQSEIADAVAEISEMMHEALTRLCVLEDRINAVRDRPRPGPNPGPIPGPNPGPQTTLRLSGGDGSPSEG